MSPVTPGQQNAVDDALLASVANQFGRKAKAHADEKELMRAAQEQELEEMGMDGPDEDEEDEEPEGPEEDEEEESSTRPETSTRPAARTSSPPSSSDDFEDVVDVPEAPEAYGTRAEKKVSTFEERYEHKKKTGRKPKWIPSKETLANQLKAKEMTYDEWIDAQNKAYDLERPSVRHELVRHEPQWVETSTGQKLPAKGTVAVRQGRPFSTAEIVERYGGGEYEIRVHLPPKGNVPPRIAKKKLDVSGEPRLGGSRPLNDNVAPPPPPTSSESIEKAAAYAMKSFTDRMLDGGGGTGGLDADAIQRPYREMTGQVIEGAKQAAAVEAAAARREADDHRARAEAAREEMEKMRAEAERRQEELQQKIADASRGSNDLIATLIPTFSQQAQVQVQTMMHTFEARESRIEANHAKEVESVSRMHEGLLSNARAAWESERTRLEVSAQNQLALLQQQLQFVQNQAALLQAENTTLRNELLQLRVAQIEQLSKGQDPIGQLAKLQEFGEVAKTVFPDLGGGGDESGLGPEAKPWMNVLNNVARAVAGVVEARKNPEAQGGQPAQAQAMMRTPQGGAYAGAEYAPPPSPPPRRRREGTAPPREAPPPRDNSQVVKLSKSGVQEALQIVEAMRSTGVPPADAANAAMDTDRAVLRELVRRPPDIVLRQLEEKGIISTGLLDEEGRAYVLEVLKQIRERNP